MKDIGRFPLVHNAGWMNPVFEDVHDEKNIHHLFFGSSCLTL